MEDAIPKDLELQLCEEIREENSRKKFGTGKLMLGAVSKSQKIILRNAAYSQMN